MAISFTPKQIWTFAVSAAVGIPAIIGLLWSVFVWFQSVPSTDAVREIVRDELRRSRAVEHILSLDAQLDEMAEDDPKRDTHLRLIRDLCGAVQADKPEPCT